MGSNPPEETLRRSESVTGEPVGSTAHDCPYFSSLLGHGRRAAIRAAGVHYDGATTARRPGAANTGSASPCTAAGAPLGSHRTTPPLVVRATAVTTTGRGTRAGAP